VPGILYSILAMRCPTCRRGEVFIKKNPYDLANVGYIHDLCPVCGQNFRPEPGFYFGAAVVSYPLTVIFNLLTAFCFYLVVGDLFNHVGSLILVLLIASLCILPLAFRYSRIVWLHIIFRYKGGPAN
jgi:hypothetical protein